MTQRVGEPAVPVINNYNSSFCASQTTNIIRQASDLTTNAIRFIDDVLYTSDPREMLTHGQKQESDPLKEKHRDEDEKSKKTIKKLSTLIMSQLATRPVNKATMCSLVQDWNRRRCCTTISILTGIGIVKAMGGLDAKRLLVLNKNVLILSCSTKTLLSYYNSMKKMEAVLNKQFQDMITIFRSMHHIGGVFACTQQSTIQQLEPQKKQRRTIPEEEELPTTPVSFF